MGDCGCNASSSNNTRNVCQDRRDMMVTYRQALSDRYQAEQDLSKRSQLNGMLSEADKVINSPDCPSIAQIAFFQSFLANGN